MISLNRQRGMLTTVLLILAMLSGACFAQQTSKTELGGWAQCPNGKTVWLEPYIHSYRADLDIVIDKRTGQTFRPITPDSPARSNAPASTNPYDYVGPINSQQPSAQPSAPTYSPAPTVVGPTYSPIVSPPVNPYPTYQPTYAPAAPRCPNCPNYTPNPYYAPRYRYDVGPYGATPGQNYGFQSGSQRPLRETYTRIK